MGLISLQEKQFGIQCLREGIRMDGRGIYDFRNIDIRVGGGDGVLGQAEVMLGKTR